MPWGPIYFCLNDTLSWPTDWLMSSSTGNSTPRRTPGARSSSPESTARSCAPTPG